ncbi:hypothetical protein GQ457_09G030100 [Hibiscus cannabinus]
MAEFIDGAEFWLRRSFLAGGRWGFEGRKRWKKRHGVVGPRRLRVVTRMSFSLGSTPSSRLLNESEITVPTLYIDKNEKNGALGNSPRSTLSGLGCSSSNGPSQVPSPPTTPFCAENVTWDLI